MTDLLLVGATGLVGQAVLRQALADSRVAKVVAVTRNPCPHSHGWRILWSTSMLCL